MATARTRSRSARSVVRKPKLPKLKGHDNDAYTAHGAEHLRNIAARLYYDADQFLKMAGGLATTGYDVLYARGFKRYERAAESIDKFQDSVWKGLQDAVENSPVKGAWYEAKDKEIPQPQFKPGEALTITLYFLVTTDKRTGKRCILQVETEPSHIRSMFRSEGDYVLQTQVTIPLALEQPKPGPSDLVLKGVTDARFDKRGFKMPKSSKRLKIAS